MSKPLSIIIILILPFCKMGNQSNEDLKSILLNFGLLLQRSNRVTVSGTAVKGVVKNAKVIINSIAKDGSCDTSDILAKGKTDFEGNYSLVYNKTGNMVCLTITNHDNETTTVYDEKKKVDVLVPQGSDFKLVTILPENRIIQNARKNTKVSPFSSMLMKRFQYLVRNSGAGADPNQLYKKASKEVVIRFGLNSGFSAIKSSLLPISPNISDSGYPELDDIPVDFTNPTDPTTAKFIAIMAGFSQLANQYKEGSELSVKDVNAVINSFATDFEDGVFDGKGSDNIPITLGTGVNQITFSNTPLTNVLFPAIGTYFDEGGILSVGAPTTEEPVTLTSTQVTGEIQFVDDTPILSPVDNPFNVVYSGSPYVFTNSLVITTVTPTVVGTLISCAVNPSLPTGLSFNTTTCEITGTPTVNQTATSYTITGTNNEGTTTAIIDITINDAAPTNLTYTGSPYVFTNGSAMTAATPSVTGTVTGCAASPALPTGLSINTATCEITGTPTVNQTATSHTITASNTGGNTTAIISITVNYAAPTGLSYTGGPFFHTKNITITTLTPTVTGVVTNCIATPTLPAGLSLNTTTCEISGTPTGVQAATNHTITASNNGGNTNSIVNITIFPPYRLTDSGQTTCYNDTTSITCGASHQGQDADYVNIPFAISFTGPTADVTYTSDYTTTDNVTGFVWKTCPEGKSGATCATGTQSYLTKANAVTACTNLNSANSGAGYAGRTNWRLPSIQELFTLINFGIAGTQKIDNTKFPGTQSDFWSSTIYNGTNTWELFTDGTLYPLLNTGTIGVRCISGSGVPTQSFTDNANGSISDNNTGLIWQKCGMGANNDASCSGSLTGGGESVGLSYCEGLTLAGRSDWRLPNVRELQSVIDYSSIPTINATYFPGTGSNPFITSTTFTEAHTNNYYISFADGTINNDSGKTAGWKTRCVAGP